MGVSRLEDLIAWQLANAFKLEIYRLLDDSPPASSDVRFRDQLRASAVSVGVNIGEGFYRFGAREFRRYLTIALASLGEATLWLQDGIEGATSTRTLATRRSRLQSAAGSPH